MQHFNSGSLIGKNIGSEPGMESLPLPLPAPPGRTLISGATLASQTLPVLLTPSLRTVGSILVISQVSRTIFTFSEVQLGGNGAPVGACIGCRLAELCLDRI